MKYLILLGLGFFTGCQEQYRYYCQNPEHFHAERCQKPKCQFTQTCPEYLVAPVLEKQIDQTKPSTNPAPVR